MLRAGLLSAVITVGAGCADPLGPQFDFALDPPVLYRLWWNEVEECAGQRGDFDSIRWFLGRPVTPEGDALVGAWSPPGVIVLRAFYATSEPAVKHELLHHLTDGGIPHYHPVFRDCTRPGPGRSVAIELGS